MTCPDKCKGCEWWFEDKGLCEKPTPCAGQTQAALSLNQKIICWTVLALFVYVLLVLGWYCGFDLIRHLIG